MEKMNQEAIEDWLIARIAQETQQSESAIELDKPFAQLGLDSTGAVAISGELESLLGQEIDPTLVFEYPTISRLAKRLARPN